MKEFDYQTLFVLDVYILRGIQWQVIKCHYSLRQYILYFSYRKKKKIYLKFVAQQ